MNLSDTSSEKIEARKFRRRQHRARYQGVSIATPAENYSGKSPKPLTAALECTIVHFVAMVFSLHMFKLMITCYLASLLPVRRPELQML